MRARVRVCVCAYVCVCVRAHVCLCMRARVSADCRGQLPRPRPYPCIAHGKIKEQFDTCHVNQNGDREADVLEALQIGAGRFEPLVGSKKHKAETLTLERFNLMCAPPIEQLELAICVEPHPLLNGQGHYVPSPMILPPIAQTTSHAEAAERFCHRGPLVPLVSVAPRRVRFIEADGGVWETHGVRDGKAVVVLEVPVEESHDVWILPRRGR